MDRFSIKSLLNRRIPARTPLTLLYWTTCAFSVGVKERYRIAGKFGGELTLVVWQSTICNSQTKIRQYFLLAYLRTCTCMESLTKSPNLNLPIFLQWRFWARQYFHGYTVQTSLFLLAGYGKPHFFIYFSMGV